MSITTLIGGAVVTLIAMAGVVVVCVAGSVFILRYVLPLALLVALIKILWDFITNGFRLAA